MMNVTLVLTSMISIENIDSERSTWVVFGNQKSNISSTWTPPGVHLPGVYVIVHLWMD